ncbi:hypothetical protein A9Q75_10575 [Colwellia psychrerythraea]|uniref:PEP motif anchor domain protein n=1 Tax=Colwellia psychrerythraea TaxID=28229 RepID=A0A1Y5ECC3_COLPS|nr:hypothetical protein A9Q75_10575 [Colwellia psychrerythraea]
MLNKLVLRALFSLSLAFSFAGAANATLISQDILFNTAGDTVDEYEVIGNITISLDTMDDWGAVQDTWESFTFYGYEVDALDPTFGEFYTEVDPDNLNAGLNFLQFDVTVFSRLSFAGYIDTFETVSTTDISFSLFDNQAESIFSAGTLALGAATVVPTPATLVLFLTAIAGLAARRKNS